jgi:hypothetical protein
VSYPRYLGESARIRAEILKCRGAQQCRWCLVIMQGGLEGWREHARVVHPDRYYRDHAH